MRTNHPIERPSSGLPARLDRRERHQLQKMETTAALAHHEIWLRQQLTQTEMVSDTAVAGTAMACVVGTAGVAAALRDAAPEMADALALLQAKHLANLAQKMDDHSWGRK